MALTEIFKAIGLALGQLTDPRFRRVFFKGIALALVSLIGIAAAFVWFVGWLTGDTTWLPLVGEVTWVDDLFSWGAALLLMFLSVFLMIPVASAITSMFLDDVADAVEAKHYPHLPRANHVPIGDALRDTVNFMGVLIGVNLVALVFYIIFAPLAPLIFWTVNGFLLGREYFTLAAIRRVGRVEAKKLRRRHMPTIWAAGVLMAMPLSVPLLNLVIPILGAATFTHLFHRLVSDPHAANIQYPPR
ncbi:MAG: EI24 domain-containing protein [Sulfitobacter sp.]|nr:EI24 domain-containing protein [Sulfitobacter sp.]